MADGTKHWYRSRRCASASADEITPARSQPAGFEVDEVRDAPDRPGTEYVFLAHREQAGCLGGVEGSRRSVGDHLEQKRQASGEARQLDGRPVPNVRMGYAFGCTGHKMWDGR